MSNTNLNVGIDGRGAQTGANTVIRALNDIINAANNADKGVKSVESSLSRLGMSNPGLSQARQKMNELNSSGQDLKKLLVSIEDRFIRIGATAVGMWVVKQIFDGLVQPLRTSLKYLADMETATLGIASSLLVVGKYQDALTNKQVKGQAAMSFAQAESLGIIEQLKVANMNTIATLDELIEAYQTALPVAMSRGFDKKQVLDFTLAMVQAAGAIGLPFNQMSEEIRSLLTEGAINPRNSRIATVLGLRNEDLREYKNNAQGLFDFLMSKLEGFTVAGQQSQNTMKGIWSNIVDVAKQLGGTAFEGVFVSLRTEMKAALDGIVTFDNVAKKANWNKEWVDGAKSLNEWLTTTFNSLVSIAKTLIEHRDLILAVVQAYVAYQVISTISLTISKLSALSTGNETAMLVAKMNALKLLGVSESQLLTVQQQSTVVKKEMSLADGAALTQQAEQIAAHKAKVISINEGVQAKIREQEASIQNIKVTRWEIGLEQDLIATKISQQRANAEILVQERLIAESRATSASAYAASSVAANGAAWSQEALAIESAERKILSDIINKQTTANMALAATMTQLNDLSAQEISLKTSQIATQEALLKSKVKAIEMDHAAILATDRYNASLAANGAAYLAVTKAQITKAQTDWVYLSNKERIIALEVAHTEALAMNKVALQANALGHVQLTGATVATTAASKALSVVWNLMGGWIGVVVIAVYGLYKAWESLIEIEKEYAKNKEKLDNETFIEQLKKETEAIEARNKAAKETVASKIQESKSAFATEMERASVAVDTTNIKLQEFEKRHKSVLSGVKSGDTIYKQLHREYREINDELDRNKKTLSELPALQKRFEAAKSAEPKHISNPYTPKEDTGPLSEADKQFNKLREGFKAFQQDAVKHGKVEDELGAKITSRNLAMRNLFAETKLASGDEAARMKKDIEGFVALANAEDTLAANKKATRAVEKAYQEQSLSDLKNNIAAKKIELTDSLEEGKISYTEYYQSIRTMVEELGNKEIEMFQSSYDAKKAEADQRAEMYWEGTITYSEYLKSVKELIEEETKLKNLKAGVAATVASANKDITKGQKDEAKLVADIEDKVLTLTKQWVAAAKAKNAYYKTTDAYKKLPAAAKKRADAMSELDEFSAGQQQKKDSSDLYKRGISAIGGEGIGSKISPIVSQYEEETQFLKKQYELRLMDQETYNMQMSAAETNHQAQMTDLVLSSALEATGLLRQAAGDSIEMQMASMLIEKGIAIARIMINTELTQSALLTSAAMAGVGLPGPAAAAAVAAATTAAMTQAQMVRTMNYISIGIIAASAVIEGINIAGKREAGGPVSAGKAYIVGEKRPEIFVPDRNGTILPNVPTNGQADNGSVVINQTVQIDARGADAGVEARIDAAMKRTKAETEASIMNSMNRGGKFAVASGRR